MSRMLSYVSPHPTTTAAAVGAEVLSQFAALARLHSDGWGTAWVDPLTDSVLLAGGFDAFADSEDSRTALASPSSSRIVYLRFASKGAPPARENAQPFLRHGVAFQHNGLIAPRDELVALLDAEARAALRGTTDSEAYLGVVIRDAERRSGARLQELAVASQVARVRSRFPGACLNAMLLSSSGLIVVHAAGTARAPAGAFAARGVDLGDLPPEHDDDYNVLRMTTTATGARIVATTGVDHAGWTRLADESVFAITADGVDGVRI